MEMDDRALTKWNPCHRSEIRKRFGLGKTQALLTAHAEYKYPTWQKQANLKFKPIVFYLFVGTAQDATTGSEVFLTTASMVGPLWTSRSRGIFVASFVMLHFLSSVQIAMSGLDITAMLQCQNRKRNIFLEVEIGRNIHAQCWHWISSEILQHQ